MTFLQAHRILKDFSDGQPLNFMLACSAMLDNLDIFIRAQAAMQQYDCNYTQLPFNTLQQYLRGTSPTQSAEVFLLLPWDFLPALDWRSGVLRQTLNLETASILLENNLQILKARPHARFIYLHAPLPPVFARQHEQLAFAAALLSAAHNLQASVLPSDYFSLSAYLQHAHPWRAAHAGNIAAAVIERALYSPPESCKLLITDLDQVLWHGLVAEDGLQNLHYGPESLGYPHFIYQSYLKQLQHDGILLAAVSRNDNELAHMPFRQGTMLLREEDFTAILASYNAKSAQIKSLATQLNLGLETCVFVDDNPLEIAEVQNALPQVHCRLFPAHEEALPIWLDELTTLFNRGPLSREDLNRTQLYRQRLQALAPSELQGADLSAFLHDLNMQLNIQQRSGESAARAIQLINKTNQFNLNGIRREAAQVDEILQNGGILISAALSDKYGEHGEVLACLCDTRHTLLAYVMSCRIFQRRAEYALLAWLIEKFAWHKLMLDYQPTERNTPLQNFIQADYFSTGADGKLQLDCGAFHTQHMQDLALFQVESNLDVAAR